MPTTSSSAFLKLVKNAGLDPKRDLDLLEVPLGNEIGPLSSGKADCAVLYEPGASQAQAQGFHCLLYTSPSPRDRQKSRMPSSA